MKPLRFDWHEKLTDYGTGVLTEGTMLTGFALWDCMNEDKGNRAFPSEETLAARRKKSARQIRRHLVELQRHGWLQLVTKHNGKAGVADVYVPVIPLVMPEPADTQTSAGLVGSTGHGEAQLPDMQRQTTGHETANHRTSAVSCQQEEQEEQEKNKNGTAIAVPPACVVFLDFIEEMPKRSGRLDMPKAKAAFDQIVASGETSADELVQCAKLYKRRTVEEHHPADRICTPANWLLRGEWKNYRIITYRSEFFDQRRIEVWRNEKRLERARKERAERDNSMGWASPNPYAMADES